MTAPVDLCNRAELALSGRNTLTAIDGTDRSPAANAYAQLYVPVVRQALSAARWNFARKPLTLSLLKAAPGTPENPAGAGSTIWDQATMPEPPWLYSYSYPSDCVQFRYLRPQLAPSLGIPSVPLFPVALGPQSWQSWDDRPPDIPFAVSTDQDNQDPPNPVPVILTNLSQAIGIYTFANMAIDTWSDQFQEVVVSALAGKRGMSGTGDKKLAQGLIALAN